MPAKLNHRIADFEYEIPKGFVDSSSLNDQCASIISEELDLQIFIDAKDLADRENEELARFCIINASECGEGNSLLETDIFEDVLAFIERRKAGEI